MVQLLVEKFNQIIQTLVLTFKLKIDEYRIVGPTGGGTEISSIIAGDGTTLGKTNIITVTLSTVASGLDVDTASSRSTVLPIQTTMVPLL